MPFVNHLENKHLLFIVYRTVNLSFFRFKTSAFSSSGIPEIVVRNMMIDSKSESELLPLIARNVHTSGAALDASTSEGADFLIYTIRGDTDSENLVTSLVDHVRIPIFIMVDLLRYEKSFTKASDLVKSGAEYISNFIARIKTV